MPTIGITSNYSIVGGMEPFSVSLLGPGNLTRQSSRAMLYQRPWSAGASQILVTDFLGKKASLSLSLVGGALQFGGGADPTTVPLQLARDSSGNLFVVGSTMATLPGNQLGTPGAIQYLYLAKVTSAGVVAWIDEVSAGVTSTTSATKMALDNSGNVIVIGTTDGILPGNLVGTQGPQSVDGFVAKFDTNGNLTWLTQIAAGNQAFVQPIQLLLDSSGNAFVGGQIQGDLTASYSGGGVGNQDAFLSEFLASNGTRSWAQQIGGGGGTNTTFQAMAISGTKFNLVGTTTGSVGTQIGTTGSVDIFVGSFSTGGSNNWLSQWGGGNNSTSTATGLAIDGSNNTDFFGTTTGSGGVMIATLALGANNGIVGQMDNTGALSWLDDVSGGTNQNVVATVGAIDAANNLYFVATSDIDMSGFGLGIGPAGSPSAIVMKIPSTGGAFTWFDQIGATGAVTPSPMLSIQSGIVYVTGVLTGSMGQSQIGTTGNQDAFVVSINADQSLNWAIQVGGGTLATTSVAQLMVDTSGNAFLSGQTSGVLGGTVNGTHGNRDSFLLKINFSGVSSWVSQLGAGGSSVTGANQILQDPSGNTYLLGQAQRQLIGSVIGPSNFYNSYVIKMNTAGQLQ